MMIKIMQMPEFYIALISILNLVIIVLLAIIGFTAKRMFHTNDKQYDLLKEIKDYMHGVDKRVTVLETHHKFKVIDGYQSKENNKLNSHSG